MSPMDGRTRLAWNVRSLRTKRGLSQEVLAFDAGVASPYLSRIENGSANPTVDVLDRLAKALCVEIDTLLRKSGGNEPRPRPLKAGRKPHGL